LAAGHVGLVGENDQEESCVAEAGAGFLRAFDDFELG